MFNKHNYNFGRVSSKHRYTQEPTRVTPQANPNSTSKAKFEQTTNIWKAREAANSQYQQVPPVPQKQYKVSFSSSEIKELQIRLWNSQMQLVCLPGNIPFCYAIDKNLLILNYFDWTDYWNQLNQVAYSILTNHTSTYYKEDAPFTWGARPIKQGVMQPLKSTETVLSIWQFILLNIAEFDSLRDWFAEVLYQVCVDLGTNSKYKTPEDLETAVGELCQALECRVFPRTEVLEDFIPEILVYKPNVSPSELPVLLKNTEDDSPDSLVNIKVYQESSIRSPPATLAEARELFERIKTPQETPQAVQRNYISDSDSGDE